MERECRKVLSPIQSGEPARKPNRQLVAILEGEMDATFALKGLWDDNANMRRDNLSNNTSILNLYIWIGDKNLAKSYSVPVIETHP